MPGYQAVDAIEDQRNAAPSWNSSTTLVNTLRERMREQGWAVGHTLELPLYGPMPKLEQRPDDIGIGLWR